MDELTDYLNRVASFKTCNSFRIRVSMGVALMTAIIRELKRLGYGDYESVRFDPGKAKRRYMGDTVGVCYYSTKSPSDDLFIITVDGKNYCLLEDYSMPDGYPDNRRELQPIHLETLEHIYDYLRLERKSNSLKK